MGRVRLAQVEMVEVVIFYSIAFVEMKMDKPNESLGPHLQSLSCYKSRFLLRYRNKLKTLQVSVFICNYVSLSSLQCSSFDR